MSPLSSRKRAANSDEEITSQPLKKKAKRKVDTKSIRRNPRRSTLSDDLDASIWNQKQRPGEAVLNHLTTHRDDSTTSLSSSDEFEEVLINKKHAYDSSDKEDKDIEFENIQTPIIADPSSNIPSGGLELTLTRDTRIPITNSRGTKKAPSKIERQIRISTHKCHVQTLMYHNAIRNSWLCNEELQTILLNQLPKPLMRLIEKWKHNSGIPSEVTPEKVQSQRTCSRSKMKHDSKNQRDWGQPAKLQAEGQVNMSAGDPLFCLLRALAQYWRQNFKINVPGLRKIGYMSLQRLDDELKSFSKDEHDPIAHGECFHDLEDFRRRAKEMQGSRDFGAQLFTALLRAIGLKTRMVASLQPVGFGWNQTEDAVDKKNRSNKNEGNKIDENDSDWSSHEDSDDKKPAPRNKKKGRIAKVSQNSRARSSKRDQQRSRCVSSHNTQVNSSDSEISSLHSDDESTLETTKNQTSSTPILQCDKDLKYPHYWSEVLSPITNTYTPVDAMVTHIIATNRELIEKFEPRSAKSEKMKQVIAYVIGHSSDGTAKDVTTRYLKGKMWPGKTKSYRYGPERIAIRDHHGKVKRYIQKDWFKIFMFLYERGSEKYPRDEIDDYEEATDLMPTIRDKKEVEAGKETLQYYKTSPEYVLERHLKREEALVPDAKPVKFFMIGKSENTIKEEVFLRKDIVTCKSVETWHKEGRAPKPGEQPLKHVPYRAATTHRRRKLAEAEEATGEKMLQGLFSQAQTEWIIPEPIENGIIPKNSFGNIDLYVDSMLPKGATHIPLRGIPKICRRLGFDFAEAVTGFEFGNRIAVPIITGAVVAEENYDVIMEEWHKEEAERKRKEDQKRKQAVLHMWRKLLMSQRVIKRLKDEHIDEDEGVDAFNPFTSKRKNSASGSDSKTKKMNIEPRHEILGGGFLPEGFDIEEPKANQYSGFFPVVNENVDKDDEQQDNFFIEGQDDSVPNTSLTSPPTPIIRSKKSSNFNLKNKGNQEQTHLSKEISDREIQNESESTKKSVRATTTRSKKVKNNREGKIVAIPVSSSTTQARRKQPPRNSARRSARVLKSPYFEHEESNTEEE